MEYLSTQTKQQHYIFTMKESEDTVSIQNVLEQYFFMRKIEAKPYSVEEQSEIFSAVLEQYASSGIKIYWQEGSEERINGCLRECIWKTQDSVSFRLKNAISAVLYEKIIEASSTEIVIDEEFVEQTFSGLKEKKEQRRQIGFTMGGFDYE